MNGAVDAIAVVHAAGEFNSAAPPLLPDLSDQNTWG
jgi:hypothetical protein